MLDEYDALYISEFNGLPFEYQRNYGTALYQLDVSDFMNDALFKGIGGIFNLSFSEKTSDFFGTNVCML